jgi:hypothetical protein
LLDKKFLPENGILKEQEYHVLKRFSSKLNNVLTLFVEYHANFRNSNELTEIIQPIIQKRRFSYYIREAADNHSTRYGCGYDVRHSYDVQTKLFCFKKLCLLISFVKQYLLFFQVENYELFFQKL